jgi:1-acyl-sn-glycerol-3-phosphate acyltransferase
MRSARVAVPQISVPILRAFAAYTAWYLRRHFHTVRVAGAENARVPLSSPLVVVMNHPSWWDPLIALTLATRLLPERTHYAPIDAQALAKYKFFARFGFFGVEQDAVAGATTFLRTGEAILRSPQSALWVTGQGTFADPRQRPIALKPGVGHLIKRVPEVTLLPVALEYPFGQERTPEALIRIGDPIPAGANIAAALEKTQDRLASDAIACRFGEYELLISGTAGVGGVYDLWRSAAAVVRGRRFHREHAS